MLRRLRIGISALLFVLISFFFLDFAEILPNSFHRLAHLQFVPAVLSLSIGILLFLIVLTLLFGRVYCSTICPMGILQDVIARISKSTGKKKKRYSYPRFNVIPTNTYGQTAQIAADLGLKAAQARLAESESKKTDTEESLLTADYLLRKARTESDIELNNSTIYVNHELGQLNHAEAEVAAKKLQEIDVAMSEARERIKTMQAQQSEIDEKIVQMKFDRYLRSKEFELLCKKTYQEMKESNSRIALNAAEVQDMMATQMARVMNLNASTYMMKKQGLLASEQTMTELYKQTGIDISNQHARFNFDQAKDWDSTERFTNVATTWINSVSFAVGQFAGATTSLQKGGFLGKSMSPIGFR